MKKNSEENFSTVEVDPISGEYFIRIPEWIMTELSWYEDTVIEVTLEGDEIILKESNGNDI
jgi:hypothetical protein